MKRCYYEILEVDRKATTAQIKSSYRKLALKYHPDKNPSEQAKKIFVELTQAYNTLTDPNERTWYDNNRQKILFNKEQMSKDDIEMYTFGFNIWNFFTVKCFEGYDDSQKGFYTVYRDVFEKIKAEEAKAYQMRQDLQQQMRKFEGFGVSETAMEKVIKFYEDWENFTTYKTFIWSDEYDTRQAQNRYIRREMEKINTKQRQKQKKNYIKTIKDLVSFLKKRDPRYREYLMKVKQEEQKKAQQKIQREKQKKKEKEQMKKVKQQLQEQRWKEIQQLKNDQPNEQQDQTYEQQNQVSYQFYCPICDKQFKSQNQLKNHEKSKMHKKNVKDLQKQVMSKEQLIEEVNNIEQSNPISEEPEKKKKKNKKKKGKKNQNSSEQEEMKKEINKTQQQQKKEEKNIKKQQSQPEDDDDDQDAFISAMLGNKKKNQTPKVEIQEKNNKNNKKTAKQKPIVKEPQSESQQQQQEGKKLGKAKQKKMKKAQQAQKNQNQGHKCKVCSQSFSSKTKLFQHLNKSGHAATKK